MKSLKNVFFALLIVGFILPLFSKEALAAEIPSVNDTDDSFTETTITYINPLYEDVINESDLKEPSDTSTCAASQYETSIEDAAISVRKQMTNRKETVEVGLQTSNEEDVTSLSRTIFQTAIKHTGVPTEGDYLYFHFGGYKCQISSSSQNGVRSITFTYTMTYYSTAEQEAEVDTAVKSLLNQLHLEHKTDYEKLCAIYDYICTNVTYDHENLNDQNYLLKYTAYAALINKTAVCQGYANLLYRLALEAGIDTRIIHGTSNGEGHAWNIAKLDNYYYNLDSTWDAGVTSYNYFLRGSENFPNHDRSDEYLTEEFNRNYVMSAEDYTPPEPDPSCPFVDVKKDDYFYDAVLWAYNNNITTGVDDTHFAPSDSCNRAQSVTFLWRAYGQPEPSSAENPFVDVKSSEYYYKAVLWAYENGITNGKSSTRFEPNDTVTRKEFLTFLWRSENKPEPETTDNPFVDVPEDQYYTKAVLWAYEKGITSGTDVTHFQPDANCLRGQVVTFLHRLSLTKTDTE